MPIHDWSRPITIHDDGAPYNRQLIAELTAAYQKKNWDWRVVTEREPIDLDHLLPEEKR